MGSQSKKCFSALTRSPWWSASTNCWILGAVWAQREYTRRVKQTMAASHCWVTTREPKSLSITKESQIAKVQRLIHSIKTSTLRGLQSETNGMKCRWETPWRLPNPQGRFVCAKIGILAHATGAALSPQAVWIDLWKPRLASQAPSLSKCRTDIVIQKKTSNRPRKSKREKCRLSDAADPPILTAKS